MTAFDDVFAAAMRQHRAGHLSDAVAGYRQALALRPDHAQTLLLLGMVLSQGADPQEGEALLRAYVARDPGNVAAHHTLGKIAQARGDDTAALACFAQAVAIDPNDSPSWSDMGTSLHRLTRFTEAIAAFTKAGECAPAWALPHHNLGNVHYDLGQYDAAEAAYRAALARDAQLYDTHSMLSLTLDRLHRSEEAEVHADEYARLAPVTVNPCRGEVSNGRVLLLLGAGLCNARTDFLFSAQRYETVIAYIRPSDPAQEELLRALPPFDFIFSAIADPDRAAPIFAAAQALCDKLAPQVSGVIINRPDHRIARTRRDKLPEVLAGIPNTVVPATRRMTAAALHQVTMQTVLSPELLVRPCGFHEGRYLERFTRGADLAAYLQKVQCPDYYVSTFYNCRNADGYFRKYRFIFIDRVAYPYHLAIDTHWIVHRFRAEMAAHPWMLAEEEAFLADYSSVFAGPLADAVQAIARTVDLDFAGMDCSLTPDGQLLVFEANATMMVHLNDSPEGYPYKHLYVPRISAAIDEMVRRRRTSNAAISLKNHPPLSIQPRP